MNTDYQTGKIPADFEIINSDHTLRSLRCRIMRRLQAFLHVTVIRNSIGMIRYFYFAKLRNMKQAYGVKLKRLGRKTIPYSFKNMHRSVTRVDRMHHLVRPVMAIGWVAMRTPYLKTLSIGPRAEGELLLIAGYGFSWRNINAIDLVSYSPRIKVGDMHEMDIPDNEYDIVFCGWCISYSDEPDRALKEMVRVTKPGGVIALSRGFNGMQPENEINWHGGKWRENSIDTILEPIRDHIDFIYFRHEVSREMAEKHGINPVVVVFSVK